MNGPEHNPAAPNPARGSAKPKRATPCRPAFGRCPECKTPLQSWGIAGAPGVALYHEIGCPVCEAVKFHDHAAACDCSDCAAGLDKRHAPQTRK